VGEWLQSGLGCFRLKNGAPGEEVSGLAQASDGIDFDAFDHGGFFGVADRKEQAADFQLTGRQGHGEDTAHGTDIAIEGEFADDEIAGQAVEGFLFGRHKDAEGNGKVEEGAFFSQISRGEIDGEPSAFAGVAIAAVLHSGFDPVTGFFDGGIGEADHDFLGHTGADVDFHLDGEGLDADNGGGAQTGKHGAFKTGNTSLSVGKFGVRGHASAV
jgi:hypothetical protein